MNAAARGLVQKLDKNERAEVSVRETVFPGTYIEICHVSHIVDQAAAQRHVPAGQDQRKIVGGPWEKPPASD